VVPAKIEGALKLHPLVQEAIVVGDGRHYCTALVAVDEDELAARATRPGAPATPLSPEVTAEIDAHVAEVNAGLSSFETIKCWSAIDAPTVESGLMTASLKVKRRQVEKQWIDLVDAMYRT
jgi:long-chain acyl-CoA synthetase